MKKIAINISLATASLLVALLLAEGLLAVCMPRKLSGIRIPDPFYGAYDPEIGWVMKAGAREMHQPSERVPPVEVRINSRGLRGPEVPYERTPGMRRILVLGDSNTFGYGLAASESYPAVLARTLGGSYEVVNAGTIGYGTDQEYLFFRREGIKYRPDLVVVGFSPGDIYDNMCSMRFGTSKPYFSLDPAGMLSLENTPVTRRIPIRDVFGENPLRDALLKRSTLYGLLYRALYNPEAILTRSVAAMSPEEGRRVTAELVREMSRVCNDEGCSLLFIVIPQEETLAGGGPEALSLRMHEAAVDILRDSGVPYIDLHAQFAALRDRGLFLPGDPVHMNERGHELVAGALASAVPSYGPAAGIRPPE